jgi:hypothetical protein
LTATSQSFFNDTRSLINDSSSLARIYDSRAYRAVS